MTPETPDFESLRRSRTFSVDSENETQQMQPTNLNDNNQGPYARRSSYETYVPSDFQGSGVDLTNPQSMQYNQLGGSSMPVLNSGMYPEAAEEPYHFQNNSSDMEYQMQPDRMKTDVIRDTGSPGQQVTYAQPYDNLEAHLLGPWPPYAAPGQNQGAEQGSDTGNMGSATANPNFMLIQNQGFGAMPGGGTTMSLEGFFGDDWDDVLMTHQQSPFRS